MVHRLALATGHVDTDRMLAAITPEQFERWWAFYDLEPWGEMPIRWSFSVLISQLSAFMAGWGGSEDYMEPQDVFDAILSVNTDEEPRNETPVEQTPATEAARMEATRVNLVAAFSGMGAVHVR